MLETVKRRIFRLRKETYNGMQLLVLPDLVLRQILEELLLSDLPSISSFRICSREANLASEFCFWRTVRFRNYYDGESTDPNLAYMIPDAQEIITRTVNRILDPKDPIRTYTRRLTVGNIAHNRASVSFDTVNGAIPLPLFLSAEILMNILDCFTNLQDLSWQLSSGMPHQVLSALHSRWPQTRLHYSLENRTFQTVLGLDRGLLRSPQLYSLIIKQYDVWRTEDMADITELIQEGGSLKVLHNLADGSHRFDVKLYIKPNHTKIPPLKDLWISQNHFVSKEYGELWLKAMDWSGLRSLRIAESHDLALLPAIRGLVPDLKRFVFTSGPMRGLGGSLAFSQTRLITFIESVKALEDVTIYSRLAIEMENICFALIKAHGKSLRKLRLSRVDYDFSKGMSWERLWPLLSQTEFLEELELDLAFDHELIEGTIEQIWNFKPSRSIELLANLSHLQHLTIRFLLREEPASFIGYDGIKVDGLSEDNCKQLVVSILDDFLTYNPFHPIDTIEVVFHGDFRGWTPLSRKYVLRRLKWPLGMEGSRCRVDALYRGRLYDPNIESGGRRLPP